MAHGLGHTCTEVGLTKCGPSPSQLARLWTSRQFSSKLVIYQMTLLEGCGKLVTILKDTSGLNPWNLYYDLDRTQSLLHVSLQDKGERSDHHEQKREKVKPE